MSTHQIIASATGKYTTACRLCMKRLFQSAPIGPPVIGEKPGFREKQRELSLLKKMYDHLKEQHPTELEQGLELSGLMTELAKEYKAFLILSAFECQDPNVSQRLENIRAMVFISVRRNTFADDALAYTASLLGSTPDQTAEIAKALRAVRDACCEFGQYAPQNGNPPALSALITP